MSIFDKLMAIKQLTFKDGEINLMNQRVMFVPNEMCVETTKILIDNPKLIAPLYQNIKKEFHEGWSNSLKKNYDFDPREFMEQLIELTNLSGWGTNKLEQFNSIKKTGIFTTINSPIPLSFKTKTTKPIDHYLRALYAGGSSTVFGEDIDWIEIECIAQGKQKCVFAFGPKKYLIKKYPKFKYQISR